MLVLPVLPPPGGRSVETRVKWQLENFGVPEPQADLRCDACGSVGGCVRREYLVRLGPLMLVQLAVYDVGTRNKLLGVRIHADERVTMRVGGTPQEYLLLAAVEHVGNSLNSGHYVCYRRVDADGSWLVLNDDGGTGIGLRHGSRLSAEEFRERQLYLCMYARAASGEGLPPVVPGHLGGHARGAGTVSDQLIIDAASVLAESEVALVAAAKRLSLDADEGRVTATVSRACVVNPTSSARRSSPRRPMARRP